MNRAALVLGALAVAVAVTGIVMAVTPDTDGLTLTAVDPSAAADAVPDDPNGEDAQVLDDYAAELGLVMVRARGAEPEVFARQVDGPGADVQVLRVSGTVGDGGAEVVLRLRRDRTRYEGWFGGHAQDYVVTGCYRWLFDGRIDDHEPERLEACPETSVIELAPGPVEPRLPDRLFDRLNGTLVGRPGPVRAAAVLADVRAQYDAAVATAVKRGVEPEHLMDPALALDDGSVAVDDDAVGVAVGHGTDCIFVRVVPGAVSVWVPDRMSLQPGETGCSAAAAARAD